MTIRNTSPSDEDSSVQGAGVCGDLSARTNAERGGPGAIPVTQHLQTAEHFRASTVFSG